MKIYGLIYKPGFARRFFSTFLMIWIAIFGIFYPGPIGKAEAAVTAYYVDAGGVGDCSSWAQACGEISTAILLASDGDVIAVKADVYTNGGVPIDIDKSVKIIGYNADGTAPAYTDFVTGETNGPTIKDIPGPLVTLFADEIQLSGFNLDTTNVATMIGISLGVFATVRYPIIEYNHFILKTASVGIEVPIGSKLISPAGINFNLFDGPADTADAFWMLVAPGGEISYDAGYDAPNEFGYVFYDLSFYHNTINYATANFTLGDGFDSTGIGQITFLNNTFNDSRGFILFDRFGAADTAKFSAISIMYNTFNLSNTFDTQIAILVGEDVTDDNVQNDWATDFMVLFNKFLQTRDATYPTVGFQDPGVAKTNPSSDLMAWANWWGSADGPTNISGVGAQATVSDHVSYNPWASAANLSGLYFDKSSLSGDAFLPAAFYSALKEGSFIIPLPSYFSDPAILFDEQAMLAGERNYDYDLTKPSSLSVYNKVVFEIPYNGGNITITLPSGTKITPATGNILDIMKLVAQSKQPSSLSGLPAGTEIFGAAELGIPNLGLNFDQPVEIKIPVGTALNGRTLNVRRSVTGTGDWTAEGLYLSSNCTVAAGYCTFQTVKASTFVVASIPGGPILPETGMEVE